MSVTEKPRVAPECHPRVLWKQRSEGTDFQLPFDLCCFFDYIYKKGIVVYNTIMFQHIRTQDHLELKA